jgi:hypothetical protein
MLAASKMSRITLTKSSFSFGVSSLPSLQLLFFLYLVSYALGKAIFANAVERFLIPFLNRTAIVLCDEMLPGFLLLWL